jgi:hypothetical protein
MPPRRSCRFFVLAYKLKSADVQVNVTDGCRTAGRLHVPSDSPAEKALNVFQAERLRPAPTAASRWEISQISASADSGMGPDPSVPQAKGNGGQLGCNPCTGARRIVLALAVRRRSIAQGCAF